MPVYSLKIQYELMCQDSFYPTQTLLKGISLEQLKTIKFHKGILPNIAAGVASFDFL